MSPAHAANSPTARIAITGTRTPGIVDEDLADRFDRYLAPFDGPASTWLLGGAAGIDTLALRWLTEHGEGDLVVAVPVARADQPSEAGAAIRQAGATGRLVQLLELRHPAGLGPEAFTVRNRWLVEHSEFVVGFPATATQDGSGTWETVNHARSLERPVLVVPVGPTPAAAAPEEN